MVLPISPQPIMPRVCVDKQFLTTTQSKIFVDNQYQTWYIWQFWRWKGVEIDYLK